MSFGYRIRREGAHVLAQITTDGRSVVLQLEGKVAESLGRALVSQGKLADEWAQAERVAMDSAILLRAGANFGLSNNAKILAEAVKEAAWNFDLRRYMPGGVKSSEAFGTPSIKVHQPIIQARY